MTDLEWADDLEPEEHRNEENGCKNAGQGVPENPHAVLRTARVHLGRMSEKQDSADEGHDYGDCHRKCSQFPVAHQELAVRALFSAAEGEQKPDPRRNYQERSEDGVVDGVETNGDRSGHGCCRADGWMDGGMEAKRHRSLTLQLWWPSQPRRYRKIIQ